MADTKEMKADTTAPVEPPVTERLDTKDLEAIALPGASQETDVKAAVPEETSSDGWPALNANHPLTLFLARLSDILEDADHNEVYGVTMDSAGDFHTKLILQKFLRANANNLDKAVDQLSKTLIWRKEYQPMKVKDEVFSQKKFGGLGYITKITDVPGSENKVDVATFNIYGAVKDNKETFGDLDAFMRWRVAVMERSVQELGIAKGTSPIPDYGMGADPYQGFQIHDYMNVSFLRQDPLVKAASKKAIEVFGAYYRECSVFFHIFYILTTFVAETMSRKFFVSVPFIMSWMFTAMRVFISKETQKKFTVMSYATNLAADLGPGVPTEYGGKAKPLDTIGETVKTE
jgi:phosphatidylinositol transfer protein SFH5